MFDWLKKKQHVYVEEEKYCIKNAKIRNLSEDLNICLNNIHMYADTTALCPGCVVYTVEPVKPSNKTPYTTFKSSPRVITGVHNSGVNQGSVFDTYSPVLGQTDNVHKKKEVIYQEDLIYSPLTKELADYICKLLNVQFRQKYQQLNSVKTSKTR